MSHLHSADLSFSSKPKLIRWFETKMIRGLVLECLTGQHKLRITSERALLSFTVALLKVLLAENVSTFNAPL